MTTRPGAVPRRGEVWWAAVPGEAKGRPCVVVSADWLNRHARDVVVVPITSVSRGNFPTRIPLHPPEGGLRVPSWAKCDQVSTVRKDRLLDAGPSGTLRPATLDAIGRAIRSSLDLG